VYFSTKKTFCACSDVIQYVQVQKITCLYVNFLNKVIRNIQYDVLLGLKWH
jgi:hypothetical protein